MKKFPLKMLLPAPGRIPQAAPSKEQAAGPGKDLKSAHRLVLQALEIANMAAERVASVEEVRGAFTEKEAEKIRKAYKTEDVPSVVGKILGLLIVRGLVFSPGKVGASRYYGAKSVLDPDTSFLPDKTSRRARVARLVAEAVAQYGRAARIGEILEVARGDYRYSDLDASDIMHDVADLARHKNAEVRSIGRVRGDKMGGILYLPASLDPGAYMPTEPLTWLEVVARAVETVWQDEVTRARKEGRRMRPFSTSAVAAALKAAPAPHPNLGDARLLPNAMLQLARESDPLIRKALRPGEVTNALWVPVGVSDEELDLGSAFASDIERVAEAVRRAVENHGRPVTQTDVQDEIDLDPSLRPAGSLKVYSVLSDAAKERIGDGKGSRRARVVCRIYRVGRAGGRTYYDYRENRIAASKVFVRYTSLELRWSGLQADERITALDSCPISSVAVGRALTVAADVDGIVREIKTVLGSKRADEVVAEDLTELLRQAAKAADRVERWLSKLNITSMQIPSEVCPLYPLRTAAEAQEFLSPFYPAASKATLHEFIRLVGDDIRRVENPDFVNRFSSDPHLAAEYLYDQVDLFIQASKRWGGHECSLQAMLAEKILERLRDDRFVFPALKSKNYEDRLVGVSCLAFLSSENGNKLLRKLALRDPEAGVRKSALWAYGFAGGVGAQELVSDRARDDEDRFVREFALKATYL